MLSCLAEGEETDSQKNKTPGNDPQDVVERLPLHHMFVVHGYKGDARILERVVVTETREVQGKYIYRRRPIVVVGDSIPPQPQAYCALKVAAHLLAHSAQVTLILSAKLLPQKHLCGGPVLDTLV